MADISKETVRQFQVREQRTRQRRAARILADLLDRSEREDLPVLAWEISAAGVQITGRSTIHPSGERRDRITAWAQALGIELAEHDHPNSGMTTITGVAKQRRTQHEFITIVLTCDVFADDEDDEAAD